MRYFGLESILFIVAVVVTATHFYLNTPDERHDQYVSSESITGEVAQMEAAFVKQIQSTLNEGGTGKLAIPHSTLIKSINVNNITSQRKTYLD